MAWFYHCHDDDYYYYDDDHHHHLSSPSRTEVSVLVTDRPDRELKSFFVTIEEALLPYTDFRRRICVGLFHQLLLDRDRK